jgi:enamine deaminase RidA (YjgF/YER057c/UK114 family)
MNLNGCTQDVCSESPWQHCCLTKITGNRFAGGSGIFVLGLLLLASPSLALAQAQASRYINPPSLVKPNGYTHVVVAPDGRTVYIAGQVALDSTGQLIGAGDFRAQTERVFQNLRRALASVGGSLDDLAKTTTFITDLKHVPAIRELRAKYFERARPPANSMVVVSSLARPELLVEIEGVAVLRSGVRLTSPQ